MSDITLSAGVRQNLLSLQKTADLMATTQNRLATGKEVNSALDNPSNFFTSASLQARSQDLSALLDSMSNGIKTLEAADNGLTSITDTLESMQSTLRQARQDKSFKTASYTVDDTVTSGNISFSGGAVGGTAVDIGLAKTEKTAGNAITAIQAADDGKDITISDGTTTTADITLSTGNTADDIVAAINAATEAAGLDVTASNDNGVISLSSNSGASITVADGGGGTAGGAAVLNFGADVTTAKTADELVSEINNTAVLEGRVRASNDKGTLRIENQSTQELSVDGVTSGGITDGSSTGASTIAGNEIRADLAEQFNLARDQLDKFSDDASFNGINLLRGDNLKLTFNETGTSTIDIQTKDGESLNSAYLGIENIDASALDSDANIDSLLEDVSAALNTIRSQSSAFGSNLSIVENRQNFTKAMMNTLQTGADNLVLADTNEEAANMLALQTRQQLSSTALSLASQADQAVLRLF